MRAAHNSTTRAMTRRSFTALIMAAALLAGSGNSLSCSQCVVQKLESSCHAPGAGGAAALTCSCCLTVATEDSSSPVGVPAGQSKTIPDAPASGLNRAAAAVPIAYPRVAARIGPADGNIPGPPLYLVKHSYLI